MRKTTTHASVFLLLTLFAISLVSCGSLPEGERESDAASPIQSTNDNRQYQSFILPNQLKVLVISDPETDKAAAALDVNIGSSSDPADRQGLTHFLEHMLFLGTEKYPEPGAYQKFISEHGGSHNAYTAFEHTNYFFEVEKDSLQPALDRFAQFFIKPLFNSEYVEREKHAVDSEYQSKLKDDGRRQYDVLKSIINPSHPFSRFSVGSLATLEDREGNSLRADLVDFYRQHYSANLMTLVVVGPQSIDSLRDLATELFRTIPSHDTRPLEIDEPLFNAGQLPLSLHIEPIKDIRRLTLQFPLPGLYPFYRSKPTHYLANLLGHEGKGSLLSYLKQEGWAEFLSAGVGHSATDSATFQITIGLTQDGMQNRDAVIQALFNQINLVKQQGIDQWRFDEQRKLSEIEFEFKEKNSAVHDATSLARQMHHYPIKDVLRAQYLLEDYDAQLLRQIIDRLQPENMLLTLIAKGLETNQTTQWFNTPYQVSPISSEQITGWVHPLPESVLALPPANPFIPDNLAINSAANGSKIPKRVAFEAGLELWHRLDTEFKTPRADFYFAIRSPIANDTARHALLTDLYVKTVNDQLSEFSYPAYLAGLNYNLYKHVRGMTVKISGYHDRQIRMLDEISKALKNPRVQDEKFAVFKDEIERKLRNQQKERPYNQALDKISKLLLESSWTEQQLLSALESIQADDLRAFTANYLNTIELVALANGNLDLREAKEMAGMLAQYFLTNSHTKMVAHQPVIKLPKSASLIAPFEVPHPDSALTVYYQGENKEIETAARYALYNQLLSAPFYEMLRTQQQRGYIVFSTPMNLMDVPALSLVIQSPNTSAIELAEHTNTFLKGFNEQLKQMTEQEFNTHIQALRSTILEKETRLSQRSNRFWHEIDRSNAAFNRRERLASAVEAYSLDELRQAFANELLGHGKRKLTILANGERFPLSVDTVDKATVIKARRDLPNSYF